MGRQLHTVVLVAPSNWKKSNGSSYIQQSIHRARLGDIDIPFSVVIVFRVICVFVMNFDLKMKIKVTMFESDCTVLDE